MTTSATMPAPPPTFHAYRSGVVYLFNFRFFHGAAGFHGAIFEVDRGILFPYSDLFLSNRMEGNVLCTLLSAPGGKCSASPRAMSSTWRAFGRARRDR